MPMALRSAIESFILLKYLGKENQELIFKKEKMGKLNHIKLNKLD